MADRIKPSDFAGPTDDYPDGKLNEHDEGGLMMAISVENGNVRLDFGKPVVWFALDPNSALALAAAITGKAMALKLEGRDGAVG
jgi:hypothetical protein